MAVKSSLLSLVFTDLVDSTAFKMQLGDQGALTHAAGAQYERAPNADCECPAAPTGGRPDDRSRSVERPASAH